jgi:hypothetical protein
MTLKTQPTDADVDAFLAAIPAPHGGRTPWPSRRRWSR